MITGRKKITAVFFQNDSGTMPVRKWLYSLPKEDRRTIGEDIKTVEFGWPIGAPTAKPLGNGLYEVRSDINGGIKARVIFTIYKHFMVLLHGFTKKTQKTPSNDLKTARRRMKKFSQHQGGEK